MGKQVNIPTIVVDYREERSGIPDLLCQLGCDVQLTSLKAGDYIVNDSIIVERKSKDDFVLSLMQGRLFKQCVLLQKSGYVTSLLIEGNPYHTVHNVSREAIRGALLSVSLSWQIPINYSANNSDTANMIMRIAEQNPKDTFMVQRYGYKPKTLQKQQLYFLQGLPLIGPKLANALMKHFKGIDRIMSASEVELAQVSGIGKNKAMRIWQFIRSGE
ncbi:ERCC4 domain-containing protein [Saccharicrinis carchari]|uniref:ERCC4 domain-containing protein n=1 Tax=Saccharicrinis carchari TaxID=1168039 RepID=UPI00163DD5D2|nr:ERCC4 domain-containing protein [Saccharicrinis carchari]